MKTAMHKIRGKGGISLSEFFVCELLKNMAFRLPGFCLLFLWQ